MKIKNKRKYSNKLKDAMETEVHLGWRVCVCVEMWTSMGEHSGLNHVR